MCENDDKYPQNAPEKPYDPIYPPKRPKSLVSVSKETPQNSRKFTNPIFRLTTEKPPFFRNLPYAPYPPGGVGGGVLGDILRKFAIYRGPDKNQFAHNPKTPLKLRIPLVE